MDVLNLNKSARTVYFYFRASYSGKKKKKKKVNLFAKSSMRSVSLTYVVSVFDPCVVNAPRRRKKSDAEGYFFSAVAVFFFFILRSEFKIFHSSCPTNFKPYLEAWKICVFSLAERDHAITTFYSLDHLTWCIRLSNENFLKPQLKTIL